MGMHKNKTQDKIKKNKERGKQRQVTSISKLIEFEAKSWKLSSTVLKVDLISSSFIYCNGRKTKRT